MKPYLTKNHQLVIAIVLVGSIFLSAMIFPGQIAARQRNPEPTPVSTDLPDDLEIKSGDTEGLIWGAVVILTIIIGGVIVQRFVLRPDINKSND